MKHANEPTTKKSRERERERERETNTHLKPFSASFYKLLGGAVLLLALIFGGIVWAARGLDCTEYSKNGVKKPGSLLSDIAGWVTERKICAKSFGKVGENVLRANIKTDRMTASKTLRIKNELGQDVFIPTRTQAELDSFLNAIKPGSGNKTMENKFEVCEVGLSASQPSTAFGNGVMGCDSGINGECSSTLNGTISETTPTTGSLCSNGNETTLTDNPSSWNWSCNGTGTDATNAECEVKKKNET